MAKEFVCPFDRIEVQPEVENAGNSKLTMAVNIPLVGRKFEDFNQPCLAEEVFNKAGSHTLFTGSGVCKRCGRTVEFDFWPVKK